MLVTVTGAPPGRTEAPRRDFTPPPDWADVATATTSEILGKLDAGR